MRAFALVLIVTAASACNSDDDATLLDVDWRGDGPILSDATRTDAPGSDGASGACDPGELHVIPCCGGAVPPCVDVLDSGVCPPNTETGQCWGASVGPTLGCVAACTPPPQFCAPAGSDCRAACNGNGWVADAGDCVCGPCA